MDPGDRQLHDHATRFDEIEPGVRNRTFGCIARERGFLTQAQLDAAVAEQKSQAQPEMLGALLLRKRILTLAQVLEILKDQDRHVLACTCGRQYLVEQRGPAEYRCGACGTSLVPPAPAALAARRIGPFEILGELGQGGIGIVYCARTPDGKVVALKTHKWGAQAKPESLARFRAEAANMAKLDHAAVVRVLEQGEDGGVPWFAMELVGGEPLDRVMPGLDLRRRIELLEKVARGVAHAHERGVVHGDLTPANVLVSPTGPKILDFGLARNKAWPIAVANPGGSPIGTPRYMSPEEVRGDWAGVDERSDTWTLGVLLYEALAGRPPFDGPNVASIADAILAAAPAWPDAPEPLLRIARQSLDPDKAIRYPNATAFADDLRRWLDGAAVAARPASAVVRLRRWLDAHRPAVVTFLALLGVLIVVAGVSIRQELDRRAALLKDERDAADRRSRDQRRDQALRRLLADGLAKADAALGITDSRERLEAAAAQAAIPLQTVIVADRTATPAALALGRLSLALGDDRAAEGWLKEAGLDGAAERAMLYARLAVLRDPHAPETLEKIRRVTPGPHRTAFEFVHARAWDKVETALAPTPPVDGIAACLRALAFRETGRLDAARREFARALTLRPRDPLTWHLAATVEDALARLTESLQLEDRPAARADRARALDALGRTTEALGDAADAARREPANAGHHELTGRLLMKLRRWRDAADALQRALDLDPARIALKPLIDECRRQ